MKTGLYRARLICAAIVAAVSAPAAAQTLNGPASVSDGDSLSVSGIRVRLFGVDAPELDQACSDGDISVPCGEMARQQLQSMIGESLVSCSGQTTDAYGRIVAVCRIGGTDLGQALVEGGWAVAYRKHSENYTAAETRARAMKAGIWGWGFQMPEDHRAARVEKEEQVEVARSQPSPRRSAAPPARRWEQNGQCLIKGNRSRRGEWIYHLPGMPYYNQTRAEDYFCTEAQAQAAGYRRAIVR